MVMDGFGMEEIHLFRVQVKKLKAFLHLVQTGLKNPQELKLPKVLKKSYCLTGDVRRLQLQRQKIQREVGQIQDNQPEAYLNILNLKATENEIAIEELVKKKDSFKKEKRNLVDQLPQKLGSGCIEEYASAKDRKLKELLKKKDLSDDSLHGIRKLLKEFAYNWTFVHKPLSMLLPSSMNRIDPIRSMAVLIGNFHDLCVALKLLEPNYIDRIAEEKERILLLNIRKEWLGEQGDMRQEIEKELKGFSINPPQKVLQ
jgi:CHAD domain-containing protein